MNISDRAKFETLALRLHVWGPEALDNGIVRHLTKGGLYLEVRNLLRSHGFSESEINTLTAVRHPPGCACWQCVIALNRAVRRSRRRRGK